MKQWVFTAKVVPGWNVAERITLSSWVVRYCKMERWSEKLAVFSTNSTTQLSICHKLITDSKFIRYKTNSQSRTNGGCLSVSRAHVCLGAQKRVKSGHDTRALILPSMIGDNQPVFSSLQPLLSSATLTLRLSLHRRNNLDLVAHPLGLQDAVAVIKTQHVCTTERTE